MPVGTMKTEYTEQGIHDNKNTLHTELNKSIQNIPTYIHNDKKKNQQSTQSCYY